MKKTLFFLIPLALLLLVSCSDQQGKKADDSGVVRTVKSMAIPQYSIGQLVGKTLQLDIQFTPSNATNRTVSWSLADPTIASVSSTGLFTALKPGKTILTATSEDGGKTATAKVSVWEPAKTRVLQKFEPADGKIYSGAGQNTADTTAMDMAMHPDRRPMIINTYDGLFFNMATISGYEIDTNIGYQTNMFPGSILEAGFALPPSKGGYLEKLVKGAYDKEIRKAARFYGSMGLKILMRIGWEFETDDAGYDSVNYAPAFRRVVDIFRQEGVQNVAYVWCASSTAEYDDYYPGDSYVDWFAYDDLNSVGNDKSFQGLPAFFDWCGYAAAHGKPVMIGEQSTWDVPFDRWLPTLQHFWKALKESPIKGFQYINTNWPPYWGGHYNSQFTQNAEYTAAYNKEMENPVYIHRDPASFNPNALVVQAARTIEKRNSSKQWEQSDDLVVARSGYSVVPKLATSVTDNKGWNVGWQNAAETDRLDFEISVPPRSAGLVSLAWNVTDGSKATPVDVSIGNRTALSSVTQRGFYAPEVLFAYDATDSENGKLPIGLRRADSTKGAIKLTLVRIQNVSADAPTPPKNVRYRGQTNAKLTWDAVPNAQRYNVYRNGILAGFSLTNNFTDNDAPPGTHTYAVSAWNGRDGEGFLTAATR